MKKIQVNFKSSRKSKVKKRIINNLLAGCLRYNLKARYTKEKMVPRIISTRRPLEVKEVSKAMFFPHSFFIFWIKCTKDLNFFHLELNSMCYRFLESHFQCVQNIDIFKEKKAKKV